MMRLYQALNSLFKQKVAELEKPEINARADVLLKEHQHKIYEHTDKLFGVLFILQWLLGIRLSFIVAPTIELAGTSHYYWHVGSAILSMAFIITVPLFLILSKPGRTITRYSVAVAQVLLGIVLVYLTGGGFESYFHIFASLGFLVFYRDWKVLVLATSIVVLESLVRGIFWPVSMLQFYDLNHWCYLDYFLWIASLDILLIYSCCKRAQEMHLIAQKQAEIEYTKDKIEDIITVQAKEVQDALFQQRALTHNIPDAIWMKGVNQEYIAVNNTFLEIHQKGTVDIIGKTDTEIWPDDLSKDGHETDQNVLAESVTLHYEESVVDSDGKTLWFDISKAPIKNEQGEVVGLVGLARNITSKKLDEEKLHAANENLSIAYQELAKQLEYKNQMEKKLLHVQKMEALGTLTGGIAHDFNNILWMILGNSEILLDELKGQPELLEIQRDIFNAAERAKGLVQQLLDFSRKKEVTHSQQLIMVNPLVKEISKMVRTILPSSIELRLNLHASHLGVLADPVKIHQILMNLCTNAYQSMKDKGILAIAVEEICLDEESLKLYPHIEKAGKYLGIEVSDTGCGIPPALLDRIFDPFFTTKEVGKGTGLGLATVHGLVREMEGTIHVYSEVGQGTTFKVYLPAIEIENPTAAETNNIEDTEIFKQKDSSKHILIADDEAIILQMLTKKLTSLGYIVSGFNNGEEALQAFEKNPNLYDLIITDQTMPKMTGVEFAKNILQQTPDKPIILATGYSRAIAEEEFKTIKLSKIMNKPFQMQELVKVISELLN